MVVAAGKDDNIAVVDDGLVDIPEDPIDDLIENRWLLDQERDDDEEEDTDDEEDWPVDDTPCARGGEPRKIARIIVITMIKITIMMMMMMVMKNWKYDDNLEEDEDYEPTEPKKIELEL